MSTTYAATPAQEALVLADIRSWDADAEPMTDAEELSYFRNILTPESMAGPGAFPFNSTPSPELSAAWVAVLTPVVGA